ncbi:MAG: DUF4175 family protein [Rhizobiales bacterium]|nr:DUF4175 family protein [Hyphomicrobiales bacterium]
MAEHFQQAERDPDLAGLERKIRLSKWALFYEQLWPRLWLPIGVLLVFALVTLGGLWSLMGGAAHQALLVGFAVLGLAALVPLIRMRWPDRAAAIARLEQHSGLAHRPITSYEDEISPATTGTRSSLLWQAHRTRLKAMFARLRVAPPRPRVDRYDPFALRALLVLATGFVALVAGDAARDRLADAGRVAPTPAGVEARLDAWVTPPVYTASPPTMLIDGSVRVATLEQGEHAADLVRVPEGSVLIVRAIGGDHGAYRMQMRTGDVRENVTIAPKGLEAAGEASGSAPANGEGEKPAASTRSPARDLTEYEVKLMADASVVISHGESAVQTWRFVVTPDEPPTIDLKDLPQVSARGALRLSYYGKDDYGIVSAEANFALSDEDAPKVLPEGSEPLYGQPPRMQLRLPKANPKEIDGTAFQDLTAHPWAGLGVALSLEARDQAGKVGRSGEHALKMPMRRFTKPLAKAVVEQRRNLFLAPDRHQRVADAIDALLIAPDKFTEDLVVYLALRTASKRLRITALPAPLEGGLGSDAETLEAWRERRQEHYVTLRSVVDQLWQVALRIEDGDLSDAERALRQAQENLMQALADGASDEEIEQRMAELREALNNFLEQLARQAHENPDGLPQMPPQGSQSLSQQDLQKMLDDIQRLSESGSRDAAQQLLSQLREMLEQLQANRGGQQQQGQGSQAMQMLEQFGNLIQEQQRLLDDTFRAQQGQGREGREGNQRGQQRGQGQRGQGQGERGQPGDRGQPQGEGEGEGLEPGGLAERQAELRRQLQQLLEQMQGLGAETPGALNGAEQAMRDAEQALGGADLPGATDQEQMALERLRDGAQELAEQILEQMQGQNGTANSDTGRDPLGRPQGARGPTLGDSVKVPDEIDVQKARRILEELRRRLSEPTRPPIELDYLERLLKRF